MHHDIRGSGKSVEGQWQCFSQAEQNDLYDIIEWIAAQPWCTGKVGMIGESYLAWVQWFAAATQPPHLACIVPFDGGADMYRDVAYHGGIMAIGFPAGWHMTGDPRPTTGWAARARTRNLGDWDLPWNVMQPPDLRRLLEDRDPDFTKIKCPVFSIGILHKVGIHLRGNLRGYEEVTTPKKLMLCHGDFEGDEMAIFNSGEMRLLCCAGTTTGSRATTPASWTRTRAQHLRARQGALPPREGVAACRATSTRELYLARGRSGGRRLANDGGLSWEAPAVGPSEFRSPYSYPDPDWSHFSGVGTAVMEDGILNPVQEDPHLHHPAAARRTSRSIGNIVLVLYAARPTRPTPTSSCRICDQFPDDEQVPGHAAAPAASSPAAGSRRRTPRPRTRR